MSLLPVQQRFFSEGSDSDFMPKSNLKADDEEKQIVQHISSWIAENDVCVFMKGSQKMPQCGFSKYVAVLLRTYGVKNFKDVNVLKDDVLR